MTLRQRWIQPVPWIAATAIGLGLTWKPAVIVGSAFALAALATTLLVGKRLARPFLLTLGLLLLGYAFVGRGFAYFGVPPLYVGELVLLLGLGVVLGGADLPALRSPLVWVLGLLAVWCALRTAPYVGTYGVLALRDAALWGYGIFTVLVASFLPRTGLLDRVPDAYRRWLPWFVVWVPIFALITHLAPSHIPMVPRTTQPLLDFKAGDVAVHLGGIAAFLMLGLHRGAYRSADRTTEGEQSPGSRGLEVVAWVGWLASFVVVASSSRAALLAIAAAMAAVLVLRPSKKWLLGILVGVLLLTSSAAVNVEIVFHEGRSLAPRQILTNFLSTFQNSSSIYLDGPRRWRLLWWSDIVQYTFNGDYFWTGKGFGVNLADDDGFQVTIDDSLRNPHNGNLTFLARAGVPGFVVWLAFQGLFGLSLLRAVRRAGRDGQESRARLLAWVLAYWVAFSVNASFDVYLEGPQGGIWFWSLCGFGIALLQTNTSPGFPIDVAPTGPTISRNETGSIGSGVGRPSAAEGSLP